jgi:hypothetical protein
MCPVAGSTIEKRPRRVNARVGWRFAVTVIDGAGAAPKW